MRLLVALFLLLTPLSAMAADALFSTGIGTGPSDKQRYEEYTSEFWFIPLRTIRIRAVDPNVYSCLGQCTYQVEIEQRNGRNLTNTLIRQSRPRLLAGTLDQPVLLRSNQQYRFRLHLESVDDEVGIRTAGSAPFPNRSGPGKMELIQAVRGKRRFTERGPIAFELHGEFVRSVEERRAERLRRRTGIRRTRRTSEKPRLRRRVVPWWQ